MQDTISNFTETLDEALSLARGYYAAVCETFGSEEKAECEYALTKCGRLILETYTSNSEPQRVLIYAPGFTEDGDFQNYTINLRF